jgi:UDP-galactopyranose mutase
LIAVSNPQNSFYFHPSIFQIFKDYTKKQWDKYPAEINASVLARLPFRLNNDDRYFADPYQVISAVSSVDLSQFWLNMWRLLSFLTAFESFWRHF